MKYIGIENGLPRYISDIQPSTNQNMKLPETVSPNAIAMTFAIGAKNLMGPHFKVDEQDAIGHELGRRYNEHAALCAVAEAAKDALQEIYNLKGIAFVGSRIPRGNEAALNSANEVAFDLIMALTQLAEIRGGGK